MSKRNISLYIIDIFIAANKLNRYTAGFNNATEFLHSEIEWDASIRELQLIGDSINILIKNGLLLNESYRRIVDFRNQIVHGYFGIDHKIVWDVIQTKIPLLINNLNTIIKESHIKIDTAIKAAITENSYNPALIKYLTELDIQNEPCEF